jgi:hypothetical protein
MLSKFFKFVKRNKEDIILFVGVALISFLSFTVGYIISESNHNEPMQFQTQIETQIETDKANGANTDDTQSSDKIQIDEQKSTQN